MWRLMCHMNSAFHSNGTIATVALLMALLVCAALLRIRTMRQRASAASIRKAPPQRRVFPFDTVRLSAIGEPMLKKARRHHRPLSMVVFEFGDLPELQAVFEGRIASSFGPLIARRLQLIAPLRGVVVRTGPTTFVVLLPNFNGARTRRAILRTLGRACCIEFDIANGEVLLLAEYTTDVLHSDAESIAQVYRELSTELAVQRRQGEHHRASIKRERESHTRPLRMAPPANASSPSSLGESATTATAA